MGTWGINLYDDDVALDTKDSYLAMLHENSSTYDDAEITKRFIDQNAAYVNDPDDSPIFWMALADTQWQCGRLEDYVRDEALKHIHDETHIERWFVESPSLAEKRQRVIFRLEKKLISPQPPKKVFNLKKQYLLPWNVGDVYAYQYHTESSQGTHFHQRYVYLVKKADETFGNFELPRFYVFRVTSKDLCSLDQLIEYGYISQFFNPSVFERYPLKPKLYAISIPCTSARVVPTKFLHYIGHLDCLNAPIDESSNDYYTVKWKDFESYSIKNFEKWDIE